MRKINKKGLFRSVFIGFVALISILSLLSLSGCIPGMGDQKTYKMDPSWSPEGDKVAFSSNKDGDYEVYIVNIKTGEVERLTNNDKQDIGPSWSSDGQSIVFSSDRDGNWEIYSLQADGTNLQKLTITEEEA